MSKELISKLNAVVDGGIKKSQLETEIGLPANSLSAVLNGHKEMPEKWVAKIELYLNPKPEKHIPENKPTPPKLVVDKLGSLALKPNDEEMKKQREINAKINADFGAGTIMFFGERDNKEYKIISTGSMSLDLALGIGGLPLGRMVEIFGLESCGKTTIALQVIANAQKQGLKCLLVDAENAFDPEYAQALGVVLDNLMYCQPDYGEQGFEVVDKKITEEQVNVVVIDSVAAMIPKAELEGAMGDSKMGLHARLMSQVCRKLVGVAAKSNCLIIFINQIRNKIGITYGNPEVTTGGMALQFYASIRLSVTRSISVENSVMNGDNKEGNKTTVKVIKNKCAPPFRSAIFNIIYGKGVDRLGEIIDVATDFGIIVKSGSWFSYNEDKLGQGKSAVRQLLEDNSDLLAEIENLVEQKISAA